MEITLLDWERVRFYGHAMDIDHRWGRVVATGLWGRAALWKY